MIQILEILNHINYEFNDGTLGKMIKGIVEATGAYFISQPIPYISFAQMRRLTKIIDSVYEQGLAYDINLDGFLEKISRIFTLYYFSNNRCAQKIRGNNFEVHCYYIKDILKKRQLRLGVEQTMNFKKKLFEYFKYPISKQDLLSSFIFARVKQSVPRSKLEQSSMNKNFFYSKIFFSFFDIRGNEHPRSTELLRNFEFGIIRETNFLRNIQISQDFISQTEKAYPEFQTEILQSEEYNFDTSYKFELKEIQKFMKENLDWLEMEQTPLMKRLIEEFQLNFKHDELETFMVDVVEGDNQKIHFVRKNKKFDFQSNKEIFSLETSFRGYEKNFVLSQADKLKAIFEAKDNSLEMRQNFFQHFLTMYYVLGTTVFLLLYLLLMFGVQKFKLRTSALNFFIKSKGKIFIGRIEISENSLKVQNKKTELLLISPTHLNRRLPRRPKQKVVQSLPFSRKSPHFFR
jgi:hypothetical protein